MMDKYIYGIFVPLSNHRGLKVKSAQQSVHPTGGSLRVFRHFVWLEVGSVKKALSRPARQRVTQTVRRLIKKQTMKPFLVLTCIALLSACQPLAVNSFTSTPSQITATSIASATYTFPPAPTKTPIPPETSTRLPPKSFNPAIISTLTPSPPTQCPKEDSNLKFSFENAYASAPPGEGNQYFTKYILDFLNSGGTLQSILSAFDK